MFDLKNLNYEYFANLDVAEILDIKELSFEDKVTCFKFFLTCDCISNSSVIANIYMLLSGVTELNGVEEDTRIFFKDIEEYVDLKLELKEELDKFNIMLVEYYLSVLASLDVVLDELKTHVTNTHFMLFKIIDVKTISKLMLKYKNKINLDNIKPVFCAQEIYSAVNNKDSLIENFILSICGEQK